MDKCSKCSGDVRKYDAKITSCYYHQILCNTCELEVAKEYWTHERKLKHLVDRLAKEGYNVSVYSIKPNAGQVDLF